MIIKYNKKGEEQIDKIEEIARKVLDIAQRKNKNGEKV